MINRLLIRIKTVQLVYAWLLSNNAQYLCDEELMASFESSYKLYNYLLGLIVKVTDYRNEQLEAGKRKYLPTQEERFPNERFVKNGVAKLIRENSSILDYCEEHELFNDFDTDVYRAIFEQVEQMPLYLAYMSQSTKPTFVQDRELWKEILNTVFPNCPLLDETLEGKDIYWNDDLTTILQFVVKTITHLKEDDEVIKQLELFKTDDDRKFAIELFHKSIDNSGELMQLINDTATNWEASRIATMEKVIMVCALAEVKYFPFIPIKITLNEYIELAKHYCSTESARFINGILDQIVGVWKSEKVINKI